jgi:hypothetical protein
MNTSDSMYAVFEIMSNSEAVLLKALAITCPDAFRKTNISDWFTSTSIIGAKSLVLSNLIILFTLLIAIFFTFFSHLVSQIIIIFLIMLIILIFYSTFRFYSLVFFYETTVRRLRSQSVNKHVEQFTIQFPQLNSHWKIIFLKIQQFGHFCVCFILFPVVRKSCTLLYSVPHVMKNY